jgi:hypothetical protein
VRLKGGGLKRGLRLQNIMPIAQMPKFLER